jgi:carboxyl-terminal processing protease
MKRIGRLAAIGAALLAGSLAVWAAPAPSISELSFFGDVFEMVRQDYVEPVSDKQLIDGTIRGLFAALDPLSAYFDADEYKKLQDDESNDSGSIGLKVTLVDGYVVVVSPMDGSPASRANLQPGDQIGKVDGELLVGLTLSEAQAKMRGKVKSAVKLTIRRGNEAPFDIALVRDSTRTLRVRSDIERDVGYIRISTFNKQTATDLNTAIREIKNKPGSNLKGVILDLRNNAVGQLDHAVAVCNLFFSKGPIVSTRGRQVESSITVEARGDDMLAGLPMVVLINGGSASASEIVAGALQDRHRAIILGTRSFGQGSAQTIIPIPGYGAIRLTTSRYYTPSGHPIQSKGIEPDVVVEQMRLEPLAEEGGQHEGDLKRSLKNDQPADQSAEKSGGSLRSSPDSDTHISREDYQLARAFDLIRGISLYHTQY